MPKNCLSNREVFALMGWCQRNAGQFPTQDAGQLSMTATHELGFYVTKNNVLHAGEAVGVKTRPQIQKAARDAAVPFADPRWTPPPGTEARDTVAVPSKYRRRTVGTPRQRNDRLPILAAAIVRLYDELGVTPDVRLRAIMEHRAVGS